MAVKQKKKKKNKPVPDIKSIVMLCMAVVLVISLISAFAIVKTHTRKHSDIPKIDKEIAFGIDVSSHNGTVEWKKVKEEADFAFIRVGYRGYTEGEIRADKKYKQNLKNANKAGIPVGVYFYSQAVNEAEAEEEAEFVLSKIEDYDISLPVVIDFEYAYKNGEKVGRLSEAKLGKNEITSLINAFCSKVRNAGYIPALYASSYIYKYHLNLTDIKNDVYIWVADYNEHITYKGHIDFWQYSEKGKCKGVKSKNVDLNYWYIKNRE